MSTTFFCSGSIRTIFLPFATHSFAQSSFVAVKLPVEALLFAQLASDSQPRITRVSEFGSASAEVASARPMTKNRSRYFIGRPSCCVFPATIRSQGSLEIAQQTYGVKLLFWRTP